MAQNSTLIGFIIRRKASNFVAFASVSLKVTLNISVAWLRLDDTYAQKKIYNLGFVARNFPVHIYASPLLAMFHINET